MRASLPILVVLVLVPALRAGEASRYLEHVKPILKEHCYRCHGAVKQRGGLRLDTGAFIRKGGDSGPAVVVKRADRSLLLERITEKEAEFRMPPQSAALKNEQVARIRAWIDAGAVSPENEARERDPRDHWAFRKPVRPAVPRGARHPIDAFLEAEQKRLGVSPLPVAGKATLLRRVYLDLIGLPPTREELRAFLDDKSSDAYEKVVDRLLASPQHGERWGRHWMDVWRYSDWYGRRQVNDVRNSYPHIWRWRDWIVDSINGDKGYDQMVREMLAADELHGNDDSKLPALGFIVRNWFSLNYDVWKQDLVEHTGKAFLGIRLECAHCHDHKYDPITQEEYFRFRAFFEPLEFRHDQVPGGPALTKYVRYKPGSGASLKPIQAGLARVFDIEPNAKTYMYRLGDARDRFDRPPVKPGAPAILAGDKLSIEPVSLPTVAWYPGAKKFARDEEVGRRVAALKAARTALEQAKKKGDANAIRLCDARVEVAKADLDSIRARIAADREKYEGVGDAVVMSKAASKAERVLALAKAKANVIAAEQAVAGAKPAKKKATEASLAKAEQAVVNATKALEKESTAYTPLGPSYPKTSTGRRKALAEWITSDDNPLTARVAVNHIWMRHFGTPLVGSVFDFGRRGKPSLHPELHDWLAVELMRPTTKGVPRWSMKHLHRLIVTSEAYKRSSRPGLGHANAKLDPTNRTRWKFDRKRMEAEVLRDSVLYLSGRLDLKRGGPEIDPKLESKSMRRSLYFAVYPEAGGTMRFLTQFDGPNPSECYRRTETIVPQQALALANGAVTQESARALAGVFAKSKMGDTEFVERAFEQVLCRAPTGEESTACVAFLARQRTLFTAGKSKAVVAMGKARESLIRVLFNHNDFVTIH